MKSRPFPASPWALFVAVSLFGAATVRGDDWPHWRGPTRNGKTAESSCYSPGWELPRQAASEAQVGHGGSAPIIAAGRAYFLGWADQKETLTCLDLKSGTLIWRQEYRAPQYGRQATGDEGLYDGPSGAPEYDTATKWLFTLGTDGELRAWDTEHGGALKWRRNLYDDYQKLFGKAPRNPVGMVASASIGRLA